MSDSEGSPHDPDGTSPSSGGRSLEGYFYQLDVSILTALDLVLAKKVAHQVVLEPASDEDLEADIADAPGALLEMIAIDNYRLVLQCKLRSTGPWKHGDLTRLLAHGKERKSARERLAEPDVRYLLVTSADLDGVTRQLRVETVGEWPLAELPPDMSKSLPADAGGRVAVLSAMDQEKVSARIERLLTARFRVPHSNLRQCREALHREALLRMRGAANGVWKRPDVERLIAEAGGYVGESTALEGFVQPTNWEALKGLVDAKHAVVIAGASGTGKTRAAKALIAYLRDTIPAIRHVIVQGGPEKILDDADSRPVVYEVEDPWGRFRLEPTSIPWNDAIAELLQSAAPDKKFVITSRSDVLHESKPRSLREKWVISLEEENYGSRERAKLFENRLPSLSPPLQPLVLRSKSEAVERLATPLEMHRYFAVLAEGPEEDENQGQYVARCLSEAHQNSIETALINNVRQRGAWDWAAITWGLFKSRACQTFNVLPAIQAGLTKRQRELEDGLEPYLNFLIAGRNLRQAESILTYQHPRVELGLEEALKDKPERSARMLCYLIEVMIDLDRGGAADWGTEGAANLVHAVRERSIVPFELPAERQAQLDDWVGARLASTGPDFREDLALTASVGSAACVPAEVARWLLNETRDKDTWLLNRWEEPVRPVKWFEKVRADPRIKKICAAFIRREIAHRNRSYPMDFADRIANLCGGAMTAAFMEAAFSIVQDGYNPNANLIAEAALEDQNGYEALLSQAISYRRELFAKPNKEFELALTNGEYDGDAGDRYYESASEDGHTAYEIIEHYVAMRRRRDGWPAIQDHAEASELLFFWLRVAQRAAEVTIEEWGAIASAVFDRAEEREFWQSMRKTLLAEFRSALRERIISGGALREVKLEALETALHAAPEEFYAAIRLLGETSQVTRIFELTLEYLAVHAAKSKEQQLDFEDIRGKFLSALPTGLVEAVNAVLASNYDGLSRDSLRLIEELEAQGNLELRSVQAEALSSAGLDVSHLIDEILSTSDDDGDAIRIATNAISVAVRHQIWTIVEASLGHRFADVREAALRALADRTPGPLAPALRNLARDKGHRVRETVLDLLTERPCAENMDAILQLAADTWEPQQAYYEQQRDFPIAHRAALLLCEPPQIDDQHITAIGKIFFETDDLDVKRMLMRAIVRNGSHEAKKKVLSFALKTGRPPHHQLAAEALFLERQFVDETLAAEITDEHLLVRRASVALPLAVVVATRADRSRAIAAVKSLAAKPERRVLLIPMAIGVADHDRDLADSILAFLPTHAALALSRIFSGEGTLSQDDLDGLGDVRTLEAVKQGLSNFMLK
ncbi:nSTAND3 domain-containing NTPase [Bradyrhizobium liaoningense]